MQENIKKGKFWPKCLGWSKQILYIFGWIIAILYINDTESYFGIFILTMTFIGTIYIWNLCLMLFTSKTMELLRNLNENNSINNIMNQLFKEKPVVNITCSCYHFEKPFINTTISKDLKKMDTKKIETYSETKQLTIFSYLDISGIFHLKETNKHFIKLKIGKEVNINDEMTLYDIQNIKKDLYFRNKDKDLYISIYVKSIVPIKKDYYLVKIKNNKSYCLLQKWVFILSNLLMVDEFYKLYFNYLCTHQYFIIKKVVSSRNNVLQNDKYSQFIPGYNILEENFVANKKDIGGVNNELNITLPTEEEIEKAQSYKKYIPNYELNENRNVVNTNNYNIDNLLNIEGIKNENKNIELNDIENENNKVMNINDQDNSNKESLIDK